MKLATAVRHMWAVVPSWVPLDTYRTFTQEHRVEHRTMYLYTMVGSCALAQALGNVANFDTYAQPATPPNPSKRRKLSTFPDDGK